MDPSGNDGLLPVISGRREDFPQPAVRCGTDGLRAGVVNPPGLTCAALPLTSEGRQRIKR
ncbi:transcriptional regulator [Escherichia coli]|nr:transcriptional regulator [Escherichia coli]